MNCVQHEPIEVKGFDEPVNAYSVLGELSEKSRQTVFQKSEPGFSLWLDSQALSEETRQVAVRYMRRLLESIEK